METCRNALRRAAGRFETGLPGSSRLHPPLVTSRGQPSPKQVGIIASADIAVKPKPRRATEDLALVMCVVPLCPPGIAREFISRGFPYWLLSIIEYKPT